MSQSAKNLLMVIGPALLLVIVVPRSLFVMVKGASDTEPPHDGCVGAEGVGGGGGAVFVIVRVGAFVFVGGGFVAVGMGVTVGERVAVGSTKSVFVAGTVDDGVKVRDGVRVRVGVDVISFSI